MHVLTPIDATSSKGAQYSQIHQQLTELLRGERDWIANASNTAALLYNLLPEVSWLGFYLWQGSELVLGPFQGKPACTRIQPGKGVCGLAAEKQEVVVVPNVNEFPGHIACDTASQSEIVIPLMNWGKLIGVLDVDSARLNRFDVEDAEGLETAVAILLNAVDSDQLPDLSESAAQ